MAVADASHPGRLKSLLIDFGNSRLHDQARGDKRRSDNIALASDDHRSVNPTFMCLSSIRARELLRELHDTQADLEKESQTPSDSTGAAREALVSRITELRQELKATCHVSIDDLESSVYGLIWAVSL